MIYAKAPDVLRDEVNNIIPGKLYLTRPIEPDWREQAGEKDQAFYITNEAGFDCFCLWKGCAFLNGDDWTRIEKDDEDAGS